MRLFIYRVRFAVYFWWRMKPFYTLRQAMAYSKKTPVHPDSYPNPIEAAKAEIDWLCN